LRGEHFSEGAPTEAASLDPCAAATAPVNAISMPTKITIRMKHPPVPTKAYHR